MIVYYSIVDAKTKRPVEWQAGKPGYGWPWQPHRMLDLIKQLEDNFDDNDKLVRRCQWGTPERVTYLSLAEAKPDIALSAEEYLKVHECLRDDRLMKSTLAYLAACQERKRAEVLQHAAKKEKK